MMPVYLHVSNSSTFMHTYIHTYVYISCVSGSDGQMHATSRIAIACAFASDYEAMNS